MNNKIRRLLELKQLSEFVEDKTLERYGDMLTFGMLHEYATQIEEHVIPISWRDAAYAIAMLENRANALRKEFPMISVVADEYKKIPYDIVLSGTGALDDEDLMRLSKEMNMHIAEQYTKSKWIRVRDRLPKDGEVVLCYAKYYEDGQEKAYIEKGHYEAESNEWSVYDYLDDGDSIVTHWMSLPEPPKSETGISSDGDCENDSPSDK